MGSSPKFHETRDTLHIARGPGHRPGPHSQSHQKEKATRSQGGALAALFAAAAADAIVLSKLDRLTRSLVGLADLIDWAQRNHLALIVLDLGLDTTTETGRLVARVMASVGD